MKGPRKTGFFAYVIAQDKVSPGTVVAAFLSIVSVFMVVYFLVTANNGTPVAIAHRLLFVLFIMILGIVTYPVGRKNWNDPYNVWSIYDGICILLAIACCIYYIGDLEGWQLRMFRPSQTDTLFGTIMIFLVLDITRRTVGMTMLCVVGFFLLHTSFADRFPGFLKTAPTAWVRIVDILVSEQGIFSEPVQSMASYIILFLLFGTILEESCIKGRRVFLDFMQNPGGRKVEFGELAEEAYRYLKKADACFGTPIERLLHMNRPAVELYLDKGVDLTREKLEIAVCVQHNNGGLAVDPWWETNVKGLFAAGEVSGTHGVYRPGGTALNAGQVGAMRAARYIAVRCRGEAMEAETFLEHFKEEIRAFIQIGEGALEKGAASADRSGWPRGTDILEIAWERVTGRMSRTGSIIRDVRLIQEAREAIQKELAGLRQEIGIRDRGQLPVLYRFRETLICQCVYLSAMEDYGTAKRGSRGSALYTDENGSLPLLVKDERFRFSLDQGEGKEQIQEIAYKEGQCTIHWRKRREIPVDDSFFENVWRGFRENGNIVEDAAKANVPDGGFSGSSKVFSG